MSKIRDTAFTKGVKEWLKRQFPQYGDKFLVYEETQIYDPNASEAVWKLKNNGKYYLAEIFLMMNTGSTEYVCDVRSDESEVVTKAHIFAGLQNIKNNLETYVKKL
jgi:hypothetical protein